MSTKIVKAGEESDKKETVETLNDKIDYAKSNIVRKTLEMAETLKKYRNVDRKWRIVIQSMWNNYHLDYVILNCPFSYKL